MHFHLLFEKFETTHTHQYIAVGIHFQKIAIECIEPEATYREWGIIFEL